MKINTILFDLDGTLIDTNTLIIESFKHTFKHYYPEKVLTNDELLSFIGPSLKDTFSKYDVSRVNEMISTYREFNINAHEQYVTIYPNVREVLKILKDRGYNLAIVTSKMVDVAKLGMKLMEIEDYFECVIGYDSVTSHKPDPESVHQALNFFNNVECSIMIGDNKSDILAGKNAKIYTAGVAWALKGSDHLHEAEPDYMLRDMNDLLTILEEEV